MQKLDLRTEAQTSPAFYFRYLFLDGRHTWLMPLLAIGGVWTWWRSGRDRDSHTGYVILWALGLLLILSFTAVSLFPLRFIPKQTNYMQIFAAPFSMLGGYWLASHLRQRWMPAVLVALIVGSLVLSAMEQQTIRVFVANSRAALAFQGAHPGVPVYGSGQANALSSMRSALDGDWPSRSGIRLLDELTKETTSVTAEDDAGDNQRPAAYAILDPEAAAWGSSPRLNFSKLPSCWKRTEVLVPQGFGIGRTVLGYLRDAATLLLPGRWAEKALQATAPYYKPRPADVYEIPKGCILRLQTD